MSPEILSTPFPGFLVSVVKEALPDGKAFNSLSGIRGDRVMGSIESSAHLSTPFPGFRAGCLGFVEGEHPFQLPFRDSLGIKNALEERYTLLSTPFLGFY